MSAVDMRHWWSTCYQQQIGAYEVLMIYLISAVDMRYWWTTWYQQQIWGIDELPDISCRYEALMDYSPCSQQIWGMIIHEKLKWYEALMIDYLLSAVDVRHWWTTWYQQPIWGINELSEQNIKFSRYCPKFHIFTKIVIFQVYLQLFRTTASSL